MSRLERKFHDPPTTVDIDLRDVRTLLLMVDAAGRGLEFDYANRAEAAFVVTGVKPRAKNRSSSRPNGMVDIGYQYVSTDDCWMQWKDKVKSPRGVRSLLM
jgi:hypothetical protein